MVAPVKSYELAAAKGSMLSDSKALLEHSWSKAGKFRKYFMPRQHVASLKCYYVIPPW